jgi:hypothetical protein
VTGGGTKEALSLPPQAERPIIRLSIKTACGLTIAVFISNPVLGKRFGIMKQYWVELNFSNSIFVMIGLAQKTTIKKASGARYD